MPIPSGFTQHSSGYWFKISDQSGPYVFDGANPVLAGAVAANSDTAALLTYTAAAVGSNGADQTNTNARGIKLVIDVTALTGTVPTLTVTLQGKDAASGKYYTILASTPLAAVATTTLEIYPGILNAANLAQGVALPRVWRVIAAIGGTTPAVTATVGASLIV